MDRRRFLRFAGGNILAGVLTDSLLPSSIASEGLHPPEGQAIAPRKALMKVGHQHESSDEILRLFAALGVNHICSALPSEQFDAQCQLRA